MHSTVVSKKLGPVYPLILLLSWLATMPVPAFGQSPPPIPANHLRIHYFRPDGNYDGWTVYAFGQTTEDQGNFNGGPVQIGGRDAFGAYFDVGITVGATDVGLIIHWGSLKDPGPDEHVNPSVQGNEFWQISGSNILWTQQPPTIQSPAPPIPANRARIHYYRPDNLFASWTVYAFGSTTEDTGNYNGGPVFVTGYDRYGAFYDVGLTANPADSADLGFIVHHISTGVKDPGPDMHLNVGRFKEAWVISGDAVVRTSQPTAAELLGSNLAKLQGYWLDRSTIAIQPGSFNANWSYTLVSAPEANLQVTETGLAGGTAMPLAPFSGALSADQLLRYPQLREYVLFKLPPGVDAAAVAQAIKGQLAVQALDATGALKYVTSLQIFGVLDDLFFYPGQLGVIFGSDGRDRRREPELRIKVWSPPARSMRLLLFNRAADPTPVGTVEMEQDASGVWTAVGDRSWSGKYYLLEVTVYDPFLRAIVENRVTDPYSIDLAMNGTKSRITDIDHPATKPSDWDEIPSPPLRSKHDLTIYELHLRDFSANDPSVPANQRGTYLAFSNPRSLGMRHLSTLANSGLKAVHLLPSFDFATVNEDRSTWLSPGDLSQFPADSPQQQAAVARARGGDGFNWGYDPVHYLAPEGSYAVDPDHRVKEYREMVKGLHRAGLRVIQDVVFNHTSSSGRNLNSVLDQVVPGYYHRLNADGNLLSGSCCPDTASEHRMFEKLMIDTLALNARQYKIDGFRFDLLSFHFTYNVANLKNALAALTLRKDGVDGSKIYLYGEGFNFGETQDNRIGPNASQVNLFGSGVGTFNDRIRDAVRGGTPFTDPRSQGFATGLVTAPSDFVTAPDPLETLLHGMDQIRVGLAGNLRDFTFTDRTGAAVTGAQVDYFGQPTGYTASPVEAVNYCSVHDKETLFDAVQAKSALTDDIGMRARRQVLAMSAVALGQGIPFFQAGDDLLRSKSLDSNSYDSGDWFNRLDFTYQSNNWGVGLPIAGENQGQWPIIQPLLANPALKAAPDQIAFSRQAFRELLLIRATSGLFRMQTLQEVQNNLRFLNTGPGQIPGLIVMKLDANGGDYGLFKHVVVVFNATTDTVRFQSPELKGLKLYLHPVQIFSSDSTVRRSSFNSSTGTASVPALTTAVFVSGRR